MDVSATALSALLYIGLGIGLAAIMMGLRRDLRRAAAVMIAMMLVGEIALVLMDAFGASSNSGKVALIAREFLLFLVALGFFRIAAMFLFQGILVRLAVPRILADLIMAVVLIVYLLVRISSGGVDLSAIAIPSAVITGALAFSLQQTLGNLWGGISLQLDNTCRIGDWVRIDNVFGQIVSIRWRYMSIATNAGETVIVPNSQLVTNKVLVLGRRGDERIPCRRDVPFEVGFAGPPSRVIAVVQDAIQRVDTYNIATSPAPTCICTGFGDRGIQYMVVYWIMDLVHDRSTDSRIRVHVYAALERAGLRLSYPHRVLLRPNRESAEVVTARQRDARLNVLARVPLFAAFTEPERLALADDLIAHRFVNDDQISRVGEHADCLYILAEGTVGVFGAANARTERPKLADLVAPDYFGEMGLLTGQARTANVIAVGDVLCYRLDKQGFDAILKARPALVDALSEVVATRQAANDKALELSAEARARHASTRAAELMHRIRAFFDIA
jgi:small-conductance mechanosensitive channel/CRP-like cAMP-binding protein